MQIQFSTMQSLGNDFMVVNSDIYALQLQEDVVRQLSNRQSGIGFDQLLMVERDDDERADVFCRIFNADGSQVMQCGNGMRCIARYAWDYGLVRAEMDALKVRTNERIIELQLMDDGLIRADMGEPILEPSKIPFNASETSDLFNYPLIINGETLNVAVLSFGNPHAVIEVDNLDNLPIEKWGQAIQTHQCFPQSVNVEFMHCVSDNEIAIRIYERGVGETKACGSGASAAAFVAYEKGLVGNDMKVTMLGGQLSAQRDDMRIILTGTAEYIDKERVLEL